jgi:hypothetical protein
MDDRVVTHFKVGVHLPGATEESPGRPVCLPVTIFYSTTIISENMTFTTTRATGRAGLGGKGRKTGRNKKQTNKRRNI